MQGLGSFLKVHHIVAKSCSSEMGFFLPKVGQQKKNKKTITTRTSHTSYFLINFPAESQPFLLDLTLTH